MQIKFVIAPIAIAATSAAPAAFAAGQELTQDYSGANQTFDTTYDSSQTDSFWSALYQYMDVYHARSLELSNSTVEVTTGDGLDFTTVKREFPAFEGAAALPNEAAGFSALASIGYTYPTLFNDYQSRQISEDVALSLTDSDVTLTFGASDADRPLKGVLMQNRAVPGTTGYAASDVAGHAVSLTRSNVTVTADAGASYKDGGAAVYLDQIGAEGGQSQYEGEKGGFGGQALETVLEVADSTITASGASIGGIFIRQSAGNGGAGKDDVSLAYGGDGGRAYGVTLRFGQGQGGPGSSVSTTGDASAAIAVISSGGTGGDGSYDGGPVSFSPDAGGGGTGGTGGTVAFRSVGDLSVTTGGADSAGLSLASTGGDGGRGGDVDDVAFGNPGAAGAGAAAGFVSAEVYSGADIATLGDGSHSIAAISRGGAGGMGGGEASDASDAVTPNGGKGGAGGDVRVDADSGTRLSTQGGSADGILAQSIGGTGGDASHASGGFGEAHAGSGGEGGQSGAVTVFSSGRIETTGDESRGILAQSIGGPGGKGADASGLVTSTAGDGAKSGEVGAVSVTQNVRGQISTTGDNSQGILAQAIAGGGGAGGDADYALFGANGGSSFPATDGGQVDLWNFGRIATAGETSFGAVAQSIGGGGGVGGTGSGVFASDGGDGGAGGGGGAATARINGSIHSSGLLAHGLIVQSIGGGGGAGGNSQAGSAFEALAIGGTGGNGGRGGSASSELESAQITTEGGGANGVVVQSIGGGGGAGGAALATSVGVGFSEAAAIGGDGGDGGDSSTASAALANGSSVRTTGDGVDGIDSHGILVQSVGGGGGSGGGASAFALATALPLGAEEGAEATPTLTISMALGGSGAGGGDARATDGEDASAVAEITGGSSVATSGTGSQGVLVQSVGGGGGSGGDSSAAYASVGFGPSRIPGVPTPNSYSLTVALGGSCSNVPDDDACHGGKGGQAQFTLGDDSAATSRVATTGNLSNGVVVQSVGGGGGHAGFGTTSSSTYFASSAASLDASLGSNGGAGGAGELAEAEILANGLIQTTGANSRGLVVQSIGGGGGIGSGGSVSMIGGLEFGGSPGDAEGAGSSSNSISSDLTLDIGAKGGNGGAGGRVTVSHAGMILTEGAGAGGILAQSVGGGGGIGGTTGADDVADAAVTEDFQALFQEIYDATQTAAAARVTVSQGGSVEIDADVTLGGSGGSGGNGGTVSMSQTGRVVTRGDLAFGVVAQSVGGGGGIGGTAVAQADRDTLSASYSDWTVTADLSLGLTGAGGSGGAGGAVAVEVGEGYIRTGESWIEASGFGATGLLAQSVGGGGGIGSDNTVLPVAPDGDRSKAALTLGGVDQIAGPGTFSIGDGGLVTLSSAPDAAGTQVIDAEGEQAHAVMLQSVGGGGGIILKGGSVDPGNRDSGFDPAADIRLGGTPDPLGVSGPRGNGGAIDTSGLDESTPLDVRAAGIGGFGLLAQSVGGGGGMVSASNSMEIASLHLGGAGIGDGGRIDLALPAGSSVETAGQAGHGIVAQSVGGGGGIVATYRYSASTFADLTTDFAYGDSSSSANGGHGGQGNGGAISIESAAGVNALGAGAIGILAQSIGGGGGMVADRSGALFLGSTGTSGRETGTGGTITMSLTGDVAGGSLAGTGIVAQSEGPDGAGAIDITLGSESGSAVSAVSGNTGIRVLGGTSANRLTVNQGSSVSAGSGTAVVQSGNGSLDVYNYGSITGSVTLAGGTLSGNPVTGTTATLAAVPGGTLYNSGVLAAAAGGTTVVTGDLVLSPAATLVPLIDFSGSGAGTFRVDGNADLAGTVAPRLSAVRPGISVPVLTVSGAVTGQLEGGSSALYDYEVSTQDGIQMISVSNREFDRQEFRLSSARSEMARELEAVFDADDAGLAGFFAELDQTAAADAASYADALGQLAPRTAMTLMSRRAAETSRIADATMSCPVFETGSAVLAEGACTYGRAGASRTDQESS
ncbi:hypothetical protein, partial [Poseidonocella sp. HB161398]|uniref:beta strand repeat-containing protein n=1 Tax=Poseidonocella sp. HB161398 TaxID=2320855 RepID=UPI001108D256